jgi:hypothetical protein
MAYFTPGSLIRCGSNAAIWQVTAINVDGSIEVVFVSGPRKPPVAVKRIEGPEKYERVEASSDSAPIPLKGETYFYQGRPVTVMRVEDGRCLIRAGNASRNLDVWVTWEELR